MRPVFLVPRIRVLKDKNVHLFSISFLGITLDGMAFPDGGKYAQFGKRFVYISKHEDDTPPLALFGRQRKILSKRGRFRFGTTTTTIKITDLLAKRENTHAFRRSKALRKGKLFLPVDGVW